MVGTDAVVFEPALLGPSTLGSALAAINQYVLRAESTSGVTRIPVNQQTMNRTSPASVQVVWTLSDGTSSTSMPASSSALVKALSVEFQRPSGTGTSVNSVSGTSSGAARVLQGSSAYSGALDIPLDGPSTVIFGLGEPSQATVQMHASLNVGSATVSFGAGSAAVNANGCRIFTTVGSLRAAQIAHGALMFLSWGLLAPAGILVARFMKGFPNAASTFWFTSHKFLQTLTVVISCIGFLLAVMIVSPGPHFDGSHALVGLAVVAASILQLLVGAFCRPPKTVEEQNARPRKRLAWELFHKGVGYCLAAMAVAAIFLGIREFCENWETSEQNLSIPYALIVAFLGSTWIAAETYNRAAAMQAARRELQKPLPESQEQEQELPPPVRNAARRQQNSGEEADQREVAEGAGSDGDDNPTPHSSFEGLSMDDASNRNRVSSEPLAGPAVTRAAATAPMRSP